MKFGSFSVKLLRYAMSPSMRREWIEITGFRLPLVFSPSPSMRREWIEISLDVRGTTIVLVSLHAEGVD